MKTLCLKFAQTCLIFLQQLLNIFAVSRTSATILCDRLLNREKPLKQFAERLPRGQLRSLRILNSRLNICNVDHKR